MSRHGRRHRQRGKRKFDVAATPVTPVTPPVADTSASMPSAPSNDAASNDA